MFLQPAMRTQFADAMIAELSSGTGVKLLEKSTAIGGRWQMAVAYEATLEINMSRHHHRDSEGPWPLSSRLIVGIGAGQVAGGWEGPQIITESVNMIIPPLDPPTESATKLI